MTITFDVYQQIHYTIGHHPAERGGMIGGKDGIINRYLYDPCKDASNRCYYPNVNVLNTILNVWAKEDILLYGIIHSHPNNMAELSSKDIEFARAILHENPKMKDVLFPIVFTEVDSTAFQIIPYIVDHTGVRYSQLKII